MTIIELKPKRIVKVLYLLIFLLALLHIANLFLYFWIGDPDKFDFIQLIDFDYEGNLPTTFSSLLFFINTMLLLILWQDEQLKNAKDGARWLGLSVVFLYLGFDESSKIHENLGDLLEQYITAEGYLYFPWSIAYLTIFLLLIILYLPFYLRLDRKTKVRFMVAALVFVTGAAGFDIISAKEAYEHGTDTILYSVLYTIEELMEMIGLVLFSYALLRLIKSREVRIAF